MSSASAMHNIGYSVPSVEHVTVVNHGFWSNGIEHHNTDAVPWTQPSHDNVANDVSLSNNWQQPDHQNIMDPRGNDHSATGLVDSISAENTGAPAPDSATFLSGSTGIESAPSLPGGSSLSQIHSGGDITAGSGGGGDPDSGWLPYSWLRDDQAGPPAAADQEMGQLTAGLATGGVLTVAIAAYAIYARQQPVWSQPARAGATPEGPEEVADKTWS